MTAGVILSKATSADTWTPLWFFAERNRTVCESRPSADGRRGLFVSAGSMVVLVRSHCWSPENSCGRELSVDSKENWSRQSSTARLPFVRRNARIFPELPGRRDSACHQWQRNPDSLKHKITRRCTRMRQPPDSVSQVNPPHRVTAVVMCHL